MLYQKAYGFLRKTNPEITERIGEADYLLAHIDQLVTGLPAYLVDYLPAQMNSQIYFYEFDHDPNSTSLRWRNNHEMYLAKFRRLLLTILGYAKEIYVDSDFLTELSTPHLFRYEDTQESVEKLDRLIIIGLQGADLTVVALPQEEVLIRVGDMNLLVETENQQFLDLVSKIATTMGLYLREYERS